MQEQPATPRWRIAGLIIIAVGIGLLLAVLALTLAIRMFAPSATAAPGASGEIPRVSLADAKAALDAGDAVFVDVRDEASYAAGHITGARSMPLGSLEQASGELDPNTWIITYCT
jgi:hypothetical protein